MSSQSLSIIYQLRDTILQLDIRIYNHIIILFKTSRYKNILPYQLRDTILQFDNIMSSQIFLLFKNVLK